MIVTLDIGTPGGKLTICAGGDDSPMGWDLQESRLVDRQDKIRASVQTVTPRENRLVVVRFKTNKLFTTLSAAEQYVLTMSAGVPFSGTLICQTEQDKGQFTRYMRNAVVNAIGVQATGVTVFVDWQITGTGFTTT